MKNIFVFFYTSPKGAFDYRLPLLLTRSIKNNFYNSKIYQISDINTPKVEGVDKLVIREKISENIMLDRAEAYRDLALLEPAIYLDTDMFVIKKFDIKKILRENEVIFLRRSFDKDIIFNTQQKGLDFKEYTNFTLGKVTSSDFIFNSKDEVSVKCSDYYENENNYVDNLRLSINTKEYLAWLSTKAYK